MPSVSKKKGSVQVKPLSGRFFDIIPPKGKSAPITTRRNSDFFRFFLIAITVFAVMGLFNIYSRGVDLMMGSKDEAYAGYDSLETGIKFLSQKDVTQAALWFKKAQDSFEALSGNTRYLTGQAGGLMKDGPYLGTAQKLIESGIAVSKMGQSLSELVVSAQQIPAAFIQAQAGGGKVSLSELVKKEMDRLNGIYTEALTLQQNLTTMNEGALPSNIRAKLSMGQQKIGELLAALKEIRGNFDTVLKLMGDKVPHRYLILLQNNNELRATGGFIGSYMIVDVDDGAITKMETKDVYQTDGQLMDNVPAPPGIDQVADRLYMRDANYSPDFPTSAESIMWFLEHSRGPSVDTVIAIDPAVAQELLEAIGPVTLPHFPYAVNAENFERIFSFHTEAKLSGTGTPKQLLFDFIPVLKARLMNVDMLVKVSGALKQLVEEKHIQAYSKDSDVESLFTRLSVDGKMVAAAPKTDFLAVVTTAIGGNKSDAYIKTNLAHRTEVAKNGGIVDYLTVTKTHTWNEKEMAKWQPLIDRFGTGKLGLSSLRYILGEGDNVDYMRVYVPKGSRLMSSNVANMTTSEDLGYTVYAFRFGPVTAGKTVAINLQYELPFRLSFGPTDNYRFVAEKQAGSENVMLTKSLVASDYLTVLKNFPENTSAFSLTPLVESPLDGNSIFLAAVGGKD